MIFQGRPRSDGEILELLNPILKEWFLRKYGSFTPPQRYAIAEAFSGRNVLISSPTGSGKTLAAFMTALSRLLDRAMEGSLEDRVYVVYVSPLKALNNDIRRNLEEPLSEIYALAEEKGIELQKIRVAVRTGDTDSGEKQRQLRKPPHILITTPESLAIVLCSPKFSRTLKNVEFLIVDELHSLAENKRGSHLSVSMERLQEIQEGRMTRIGLSATIHPLDEVARFLVGYENGRERDCVVADVTFEKKIDISVLSPVENLFTATAEEISEKLYSTLAGMIRKSRTTLIFTNTRSATERVVFNLKKILGEDFPIAAHHSSLSKNVRLDVEERLKRGELRCVVSSTSLELGIDIGYIDLVVLVGSPKSINRALQRIGRSGHRLHETSVGRIVVVDHDDLVECAVLAREALERRLDRIHIPEKPLDVLCQHVVGMAIEKRWKVDEAFEVIRRAYPYRNLTRDEFLSVLRYLAGKYSELEEKRVYGKIWFDEEEMEFGRRGKMVRPIYYLNTGTIPDEVAITVVTRDGRVVGKVEEEFAEKLVRGDIFVLAGKTYRFLRSRGMKIVVEDAKDEKPTVPSWFSEQLPLSYDLALRVQEFRKEMEERLEEGSAVEWLLREFPIDGNAARSIAEYFDEQRRFSVIPHSRRLVVEVLEEDRNYYFFHTLIGRRANNAVARVFAFRAGRMRRCNVQFTINDNGFVLILPKTKPLRVEEIETLFDTAGFRDDLVESLMKTEILRRRFRHVAVRSFMILRNYLGREKSVWRQQLSADTLLKLLLKHFGRDFPVIRETFREIMEDAMDVANALDYLERVGRDVKLEITRVPYPSPFGLNLYVMGDEDVVLMEDRRKVLRELHQKILSYLAAQS